MKCVTAGYNYKYYTIVVIQCHAGD